MRKQANRLELNGICSLFGRVALAVTLAVALAACGGGDTTATGTPGAKTDTSTDLGTGDLGGTDQDVIGLDENGSSDVAGQDGDTSGSDIATPDGTDTDASDAGDTGSICPGGAGCPCQTKNDCTESGQCIQTPKGQVCAKLCIKSEDCGAGEGCVQGLGGIDAPFICKPKWASICNPCNSNDLCLQLDASAKCIDGGDKGAFCGSGCSVDTDCPGGYECKNSKDVSGAESLQCVVKGAAACTCSEYAVSNKLQTTCFVTAGEAKCKGNRICTPSGLTGCQAADPKPEECNGADDDCNGQTDEGTCDDKLACTDNICKGNAGCENPAKNGTCDADGTVCTKDDTCVGGKCIAGQVVNCDDKNDCTLDSCDMAKGCTYTFDDGKFCNSDDNPCTENDACKSGKCEPGAAKACQASDQCTTGKCNTLDGKCKYSFQDAFPCNDGNACTDKDKCDLTKGDCFGSSVSCDDLNPCTADSCNPTAGCTHDKTITTSCDDGDACTAKDVCSQGACGGAAIDPSKPKDIGGCNDGNPCTDDGCNPAIGCTNKPNTGNTCDDGNPCTSGDICEVGTCKSGTNVCACTADSDCAKKEDGNLCNGTLYCDKTSAPYQCKVNPITIVDCAPIAANDGQCKSTTCNTQNGKCDTALKSDNLDCDADGSFCTDKDSCQSGTCTPGAKLVCDDKNPCTTDACDPKKVGGCVFDYNTLPCDADQNACTVGDVCQAGNCIAGAKKNCDDNEPCTQDGCDKTGGNCTYTNLTVSCEDGNNCTIGDKCGGGACIPGPGPNCDDNNPCTDDTCDSKSGCKNAINSNTIVKGCYSGDPATKGVGTCKVGAQQCDIQGKLGACTGDVLPATKEACDGADDNCNGVTDEGCKPTAFVARMSTAVVSGTGAKYGAKAMVGGNSVVGESAGAKNTARFGFMTWVKALLGL